MRQLPPTSAERRSLRLALIVWALTAAQAIWWTARFAASGAADGPAAAAAAITAVATVLLIPYARHNLRELRRSRTRSDLRSGPSPDPAPEQSDWAAIAQLGPEQRGIVIGQFGYAVSGDVASAASAGPGTAVIGQLGYGKHKLWLDTLMSLPLESIPADKLIIVTQHNLPAAMAKATGRPGAHFARDEARPQS